MVHTALSTHRWLGSAAHCPASGEDPSDRRPGSAATEVAGWSQIVGRPEIRRYSGSPPKDEPVGVRPAALLPVAMQPRSVGGDFSERWLIVVTVGWNGLYQHMASCGWRGGMGKFLPMPLASRVGLVVGSAHRALTGECLRNRRAQAQAPESELVI